MRTPDCYRQRKSTNHPSAHRRCRRDILHGPGRATPSASVPGSPWRVMSADYAEIILGSLRKADATGLEVADGQRQHLRGRTGARHPAVSEPAHFGGGPQRCPRCRRGPLLSRLSRRRAAAILPGRRRPPAQRDRRNWRNAGMSTPRRTGPSTRSPTAEPAMPRARTICATSTPPSTMPRPPARPYSRRPLCHPAGRETLPASSQTMAAGWILVGRSVQHVPHARSRSPSTAPRAPLSLPPHEGFLSPCLPKAC